MSAADALREAAAAEQARYAAPFAEGPRQPPAATDTLPEIARRRRELLADVDEVARESA